MRTVIVTGGNKGIGRSISRAFHEQGDFVIVAARDDNGIAAELGDRAEFVHCDVRKPEALHNVAARAIERTGRLDIFVNNAGYSQWRSVDEVDQAFWDDMFAVNLRGMFFGCQAAARRMAGGGVIINMSSLASKRGTPNNSVYCATKFGANALTQALAKELGPRGIRVNGVCPVLVRTEGLTDALAEPGSPANGDVERFLTNFAQTQSALKRLPTGEEVAQMCLFLASSSAAAITGQNINVDCGVLPQ